MKKIGRFGRNAEMDLLRSFTAIAFIAIGVALIATSPCLGQPAPRFKVDPAWPQPLPPGEILGQVSGIAVDPADDSIWIIHRPGSLVDDEKSAAKLPPETRCCKAAAPVIQFDRSGKVLRRWGGSGQGYNWPG